MRYSFTGLSFVFAITCLTAQLGQGEGSDESGVEVAVAVPLAESDDEPATGRDAEVAQTAADKRNYQGSPGDFTRIMRSPDTFSRILRSSDPAMESSVGSSPSSTSEDQDMPRYLRDMSFTRILRTPNSGSSFTRILRSPTADTSYSRSQRSLSSPSSFSRILRSSPSSSFSRILRVSPSAFSRILKKRSGQDTFSRILRSPSPVAGEDGLYKDLYGEPIDLNVDLKIVPGSFGDTTTNQSARGKRGNSNSSFSRILRGDDFSRILRSSSFSRIL